MLRRPRAEDVLARPACVEDDQVHRVVRDPPRTSSAATCGTMEQHPRRANKCRDLDTVRGRRPPRPAKPRHWAWANLMRRAFDLDVLACPRCGGRLRLLGTIEDPAAIRAILDSLAASAECADRAPPPDMLEPATLATQV